MNWVQNGKKKDFLEVMLYLIITNLVFTKLFTDIQTSTPLSLAIPSSSLALSSDQQSSFQPVGSLISSLWSLNKSWWRWKCRSTHKLTALLLPTAQLCLLHNGLVQYPHAAHIYLSILCFPLPLLVNNTLLVLTLPPVGAATLSHREATLPLSSFLQVMAW